MPETFVATQRTTSAYNKYSPQLQVVGSKIYFVWYEYDAANKRQIWTAEMNLDGTGWVATQRTTSAYDKYSPQLQVVGSKIYFVWQEYDASSYYQIWTAEMNLDGTGWVATQRTTSAYDKYSPQFQVVGSKIYFVWYEYDAANKRQIWTAEMNLDGTGWVATQRTTSAYDKYSPQLQVVGSKIYFVWQEYDASSYYQIWTAEMNLDGTGWVATQRTTSAYNKYSPQFQVVDSKIYFVWRLYEAAYYQIWTAEMNLDGTGWVATQRTTSAYNKYSPQFQVVDSKIYFVWREYDASSYYQIWTAEMNLDGTGWVATQRTTSAYDKNSPQFQVVGSKIYFVWYEYDAANKRQIWTAEMNLDGTGWVATQRTTSAYDKYYPQLQVVGSKIYFVWYEYDAAYYQIWTGELDTPLTDSGVGVDAVTITDVGYGASDYGSGSDAVGLSAVIPVSDTGVGTEGLSLSAIISLLEQGVGVDLASLFMSASDSGQGTENISLNASVTIEDSGEGTESLSEAKAFFYVSEDGVLSPLNVKVTRDSKQGVLSSIEHFTEEVPGRHGEHVFGYRLRGKVIELTVVSEEEFTVNQREQIKRQIAQYLNPLKGEQPLVFADDPEKTYYVKYAGKIDLNQYPSWLHFTIPFKSSQPYVYGSFLSTKTGSGTIANDGNVETPVTIEIAGPVTDPSVIVGSDILTYSGTIEAGETLVIDTEMLTVELDGINVLQNFTGGFPKLQPGDTVIAAASAGTTTFKWRARWVY